MQDTEIITHFSYKKFIQNGLVFESFGIIFETFTRCNIKISDLTNHLLSVTNYIITPKTQYKQGSEIIYYPNGKIKRENYYKHNRLHGCIKEYYDDGNLRKETIFQNGKRDGMIIEYYKNKQHKAELIFENDKLHGVQRGFTDNGDVRFEYRYHRGIPLY